MKPNAQEKAALTGGSLNPMNISKKIDMNTIPKQSAIEKQIMCCVKKIGYDFETRTGFLQLPDTHCTDMNGAIQLFKAIDSQVQGIYAGDIYYGVLSGQWSAVTMRGHHTEIEAGLVADGSAK